MKYANSLTSKDMFERGVGFDRFLKMFDQLPGDGYPPYNLYEEGQDKYVIEMALAGFQESDLEITLTQNELTVKGQKISENAQEEADQSRTRTYLHKGISTRTFRKKFILAENIQIDRAEIDNGILKIHLYREIPEEKKPQQIAISRTSSI